MKKSIAVIILTYGNYSGLERTLNSVLCQTYPVDQILVSDDGSGVLFSNDLRIKFEQAKKDGILSFRQNDNNLGTVAHMNRAAALTNSAYIKFLSAGDALSDPDALEKLVSFAEENGSVAVASHTLVCDAELRRGFYLFPGKRRGRAFMQPPRQLYQILATKNLVSAVGVLFSRRFFTEARGFDEEYRLLEDWPAWLRLTREGYEIPLLDQKTCLYAIGGVSSKNADAFAAQELRTDMLRCYEKEIIPYLDEFSSADAYRIRYGYDQLRGITSSELLKKYHLLELKTRLKRRIKQCIFRHSRR